MYYVLQLFMITDLQTMDWQLPDIGKTITNNILPNRLSAYVVRIGRYIHSVDRR